MYYGTRPWTIFGEGRAQAEKLAEGGFNEGKGKPYIHEDNRFVTKGDMLYTTTMEWPPNGRLVIRSLAKYNPHYPKEIQKVEWLPTGQSLAFERTETGLWVTLPDRKSDELSYAIALGIYS